MTESAMECPVEPINIDLWRDVPVIEGRAATLEDVNNCIAVFSLDGAGRAVTGINLPARALFTDENGQQHEVVIDQTETDPSGEMFLTGYVSQDGTYGVALLNEFKILERSTGN